MNNFTFPEIKTDRLLLRQLQKSDWQMICFLRSDKKVNEYVRRPDAKTREDAISFIEKIAVAVESQQSFYWVISLLDHSQMIGTISLWNFSNDRKTAEVGYDLSPDFQKKGIMDEALKAVLEFGFTKCKLDLIEACTHRNNEPSKNLLTRNSFKIVAGKTDEDNENNIIFKIKNYNY